MKIAVFAGTFDPFTIGHYDLVKRASEVFDKINVLVRNGKMNLNLILRIQTKFHLFNHILFTKIEDIHDTE